MPRLSSLAALAALAAIAAAPAANAQAAAKDSLTLSPAQVVGVAEPGTRVGPLALSNGTEEAYRVAVVPVLLRQSREGALQVRDDAASLAAARRLVRPAVRRFTLRPGDERSVTGRVRRAGGRRGVTGGLLFRAVPARRKAGITNILQLNGTLFLRPRHARTSIAALEGRAEQAGPGVLRLLTTVRNSGGTYAAVTGRIAVRDGSGRVVTRERIDGQTLIPGATVDLAATLRRRLPAGAYTVEATVGSGRVRRSVSSRMTLFGPGEVRTRNAKLVRVGTPEAVAGEPFAVEASFQNTGNVDYAPSATYEIRSPTSGPDGEVLASGSLDARPARPDARGTIAGEIELPAKLRQADLSVVLRDGDRELDRRGVGVTVAEKPSLSARVSDTVARHPLAMLSIMLAAVLAAMAAMATVVLRR
jgi:hypothetical protein